MGGAASKAIRDIHRGQPVYSPTVAKGLGDLQPAAAGRARRAGKSVRHLTTREREVLQLVAEGRANKEIAADLNISIKTVEKHRQSVMHKLGTHDAAGLTRYAIAAGIIESSVQCTIIE